jgi:hypothetical protein
MAHLSELIIQHPECNSFDELRQLVVQAAKEGEIFMHFDVKPDYRDTPRDWYMRLESAFYSGDKYTDKWGYKP